MAEVDCEPLVPQNQIVGLDEIVEAMRIHKSTLRRMVASGRFPRPLDWPGKRVVWSRAAVRAYVNNLLGVGLN